MKPTKYTFSLNENEWTYIDQYFQYLEDNKEKFPEELFKYAINNENYHLHGDKTLHDSWLKSYHVSKNYVKQVVSTSIEIVLLQAMHEKDVILTYSGVTDIETFLTPTLRKGEKEWKLIRPQDLLFHEFHYVSPGVFRHFLEFDSGIWIDITFTEFKYSEKPLPQLQLIGGL